MSLAGSGGLLPICEPTDAGPSRFEERSAGAIGRVTTRREDRRWIQCLLDPVDELPVRCTVLQQMGHAGWANPIRHEALCHSLAHQTLQTRRSASLCHGIRSIEQQGDGGCAVTRGERGQGDGRFQLVLATHAFYELNEADHVTGAQRYDGREPEQTASVACGVDVFRIGHSAGVGVSKS